MARSTRSKRSLKRRSKSKVRIPLSKGSLFGYTLKDPAYFRRAILREIIKNKEATYSQVIKRLNVLAIYNKNKSPETTAKIRSDISYVQTKLRQYSKTFRQKKSRSRKKY